MKTARTPHSGFTLIEMIIVIVITGIVAGIVAMYIRNSTDSYLVSVHRANLTDAADVALRRLERDIHLALPNSVRVVDSSGTVGSCIPTAVTCYVEFIPTTAGGRYRAFGDSSTGGTSLDFTNPANTAFDVLGPMPSPLAFGASGDYIVVYNAGYNSGNQNNAYLNGSAACSTFGQGCNIAQVNSYVGNTITLSSNPFANLKPVISSPNNRFQVVPNSGPVTYSCRPLAAGPINRYTNYPFATAQPVAFTVPPATVSLITSNATCQVDYNHTPNSLVRVGILFVSITITDATTAESVTVFREIHVDNAP